MRRSLGASWRMKNLSRSPSTDNDVTGRKGLSLHRFISLILAKRIRSRETFKSYRRRANKACGILPSAHFCFINALAGKPFFSNNIKHFFFPPSARWQGMRMTGENTETLHLTMLERESSGSYACAASNTEGETRSSSLYLKVQCK